MADIAASNVAYSQQSSGVSSDARVSRVFSLTFGNGALTYPAGGIPLVKGNLGCPNAVQDFHFVSDAASNGFVYKYDLTNNKIRIYQGDNDAVADGPLIELVASTATPAATTLVVGVTGF